MILMAEKVLPFVNEAARSLGGVRRAAQGTAFTVDAQGALPVGTDRRGSRREAPLAVASLTLSPPICSMWDDQIEADARDA